MYDCESEYIFWISTNKFGLLIENSPSYEDNPHVTTEPSFFNAANVALFEYILTTSTS